VTLRMRYEAWIRRSLASVERRADVRSALKLAVS